MASAFYLALVNSNTNEEGGLEKKLLIFKQIIRFKCTNKRETDQF